MDEQRIRAYVELIELLLGCTDDGQMAKILQAYDELIDAELIDVMQHYASHLESQGHGNAAQWLLGLRKYLAEEDLGIKDLEAEDLTPFLLEMLQLVGESVGKSNGNAQQVYLFLAQHQEKLTKSLLQTLSKLAAQLLADDAGQESIATLLFTFGNLISKFRLGQHWLNLELSITAYQLALQVFTREAFPEDWASTQHNLAIAYRKRIRGKRADNLEQAITTAQMALQVFTREAFPEDWASAQHNLAIAYRKRIRGERADNLEQAIIGYKMALEVRTRETFPYEWAAAQNDLAVAYSDRIRGERADNLEQAIASAQMALEVRTREAFPEDWAMTQNNLANAYNERIRGERAENWEQALVAYHLALEVRTREAFPEDWAMTQNNLVGAYVQRIRGDRAENIEQAIAAAQMALEVRTREAFPYEWANIQHNLAAAYSARIQGEDADNKEQAITANELALQVHTREAFPYEWAMTQNTLAVAYSDRIRGDRAENLEQAITANKLALQVYTREAFPYEWARTQNNLAAAYSDRIRGERAHNIEQAINANKLALQVRTCDAFPQNCRQTARNLGNLYFEQQAWAEAANIYTLALQAGEILYKSALLLSSKAAELAETNDLPRRTAYALARSGNLQKAAEVLEQGRARGLSETLDRDRANLTELQPKQNDLYTQYQEITTQLRNLETQERLRMISDDRHSLNPKFLRTEAQKLHQALTKTIDQIRLVLGDENFLSQPSFDNIRQAFRPGIPLVYLVPTPAGSLALIVTQDNITNIWFDDFNETRLRELLVKWFNIYDKHQANRQASLEEIDEGTHQLWQSLMAPLIDHLKQRNFQQATLIPTGFFSLLPLHAAWTEDSTTPTGRLYALDVIDFTYAPNARSLSTSQEIAHRTSTLTDSILAIDEPKHHEAEPLPNSTREVQAAISTFQNPKILRHEQATQDAVLNALPHYNVLHISCHGKANLGEPLTSGLLMSDGILTLRDILDLKLDGIRLVILSACETGLVGIKLADEVISLPTGLLQAGVAGVAASLWSVSELSTMMLLTRFYDLWRIEHLEIDQALHQAQQWIRDSTNGEKAAYFKASITESAQRKMPAEIANFLHQFVIVKNRNGRDFAHPFHWAAFHYVGV